MIFIPILPRTLPYWKFYFRLIQYITENLPTVAVAALLLANIALSCAIIGLLLRKVRTKT